VGEPKKDALSPAEPSAFEWRPSGVRAIADEAAPSEGPPRSSDTSIHALDRDLMVGVERFFSDVSEDRPNIDVACLKRALEIQNDELAARVLAVFDRDRDGLVDRDDFVESMRQLVRGTPRDKLLFAFRIHDLNQDGFIEESELVRMLVLGFAEDKVNVDRTVSVRLARALVVAADRSRDGRLSFSEFEAVLRQHHDVFSQITRSGVRWAAPNEAILARLDNDDPADASVFRYLDEHAAAAIVLVAWTAVNAALFVHAFMTYAALGATTWVELARGFGACLNFNGALVVVPVLRRFWTWVRRSALGRRLPIDSAVTFHRIVGNALFALAVLHSAAHVVNQAVKRPTAAQWEAFFSRGAGFTGAVLLAVFAVMWLFSRSFVRKRGRFELFYFTHLLYPAWFAVALLHGPVFWKWALLPLVGLVLEFAFRAGKRAARVDVLNAAALRSGVTRVELEKPQGFEYNAGQYVFVCIPEIARHEWHPFTLSSAPEKASLTLHVRNDGDWTGSLRKVVERRAVLPAPKPFRVHLDGPYGAPSEHVFEARCAVLIAGGIGVTPFASILESIILRSKTDANSRLEKVHFFWLNRDRYSFEWFLELLGKLDAIDERGLVELHIFMTGGRGDASTSLTDLARCLDEEAGRADLVTGLSARTRMGHPDWNRELAIIAAEHPPDTVDAFFCGRPELGRKVRRACAESGIRLREERF
jgi:predicted ferric reductase/Ca2+-binding EF-hand superfamily protein